MPNINYESLFAASDSKVMVVTPGGSVVRFV